MGVYKRGKVWWMSLVHNGKRIRRSTEVSDRRVAEKIHAKVQTEITEGKWFEKLPGTSMTFAELAEIYETEELKHTKSYSSMTSYFEGLRKFFGEYRLGDIEDKIIREFIRCRLAEDVVPGTIKRQLNIFIRMFNFAREEKLIRAVPLFKWPKGVKDKLDVERVRYLSFQEYDRLLACCPDWLKDIVTVAAWTGLRQRNVLELKRNEVDLVQRAIYIEGEQVKNGEDQGKPIPGPAYAVLERKMKVIHISGSSYVLGDEHGAPYHKQRVHRHFRKALKKAGITDFRYHDLRHCYGSWNAQNGVDLLPLSMLLGHKDLRMTKRYSHLNTASLLKAVAPLEKSYQNRVTNQSQ